MSCQRMAFEHVAGPLRGKTAGWADMGGPDRYEPANTGLLWPGLSWRCLISHRHMWAHIGEPWVAYASVCWPGLAHAGPA